MVTKLFPIGLILLVLVAGSCSLVSIPVDGIYLIPEGYTGDVIIFFDQPDGVIPEVESGRSVYRIPEDGVLRVKVRGGTGIINRSYFYVGDRNERREVKYLRVTGDRTPAGEPQNPFGDISRQDYENSIFVMNDGGLGSFNTKRGVVQFKSFIIGTPKDSERLYDRMQKRISGFQRDFTGQSNDGMHPAADTLAVIYLQSRGAAGDAGR